MASLPDYYSILNVPKSASYDQIRTAYKKESLRTHPDRLTKATASEKKIATEQFQAVADAYFVLSDKTRRSEYDMLARSSGTNKHSAGAGDFAFKDFASMFGAGGGHSGEADFEDLPRAETGRPDPQGVFANVFDDLLRPEVDRLVPWWSYVGAVSGAGLGFIVANIPGAMVGALAGNRIGKIRDAKGKSVAAVFADLGGDQKAEILRALAAKVLGTAASAI